MTLTECSHGHNVSTFQPSASMRERLWVTNDRCFCFVSLAMSCDVGLWKDVLNHDMVRLWNVRKYPAACPTSFDCVQCHYTYHIASSGTWSNHQLSPCHGMELQVISCETCDMFPATTCEVTTHYVLWCHAVPFADTSFQPNSMRCYVASST